ncbi:MAG TPA: hypothetical protein VN893_19210, partial [Bryobacteraceae bacterium]|nr:hypothetical protein [Bryobacteraceae bacterium]
RTASELYQIMHGFLPFAITFAILFQIWYAQFLWFRRYGLEDTTTVLLNGALLFMVLFYVYPLKFLFTYLAGTLMGGSGMTHLADGRLVPILAAGDAVPMMAIYDAGFIAVFTVFILLYGHAWRRRDALDLSAGERFDTVTQIGANACFAAVGGVSLLIVLIGGASFAGWAGFAYFLLGPVLTVYYSVMGARKRKLAARG